MVNFSIQVCLGSPLTYGLNTYNHFIEIILKALEHVISKVCDILKDKPILWWYPYKCHIPKF
jgi:hypothetical protein